MNSVIMCVHKVWKAFIHLINLAKSLISGWFNRKSDSEPSYASQIIFSQEVSEKIDKAVKEGNLLNVIHVVNEIMQRMCGYQVRIAVTGDSGNGMSSFINALRLIGHEEEDSAPTGVVRTTQKPACYSSSSFPNVDLWDLPGTGVTAQSMENYLEEMEFDKYDLIIIIASEQFSSNHVKLAKAMQRMRKRFYVVWTKLDKDLSTSAHSEPQLLQSIQKSIRENLQKEGVKVPPIFLVSSIDPSLHDFPKLRDTLEKDLSSIRHDGLLGTLFQICKKTINQKVESINKNIDEDNLKAIGISNPDNLEECQKVFQEIFGVDDRSLHQVALSMSQPDAYSRDAKPSQGTQGDQQDGWTVSQLHHSGTQYFFTSLDYISSYFGSRRHRCTQLKHELDEVAKQTKKILWEILEKSIILPQKG